MNVKYGCYIKGRGWIKSVDFLKSDFKCCRSAGDIHRMFILSDKSELTGLLTRYSTIFKDIQYELKEIPYDSLMDKRVVSSKKRDNNYSYNFKQFPSMKNTNKRSRPYNNYCNVCNLYVDSSEISSECVCVHCLNKLYLIFASIYDDIDDEIKEAWERAKIIDEI